MHARHREDLQACYHNAENEKDTIRVTLEQLKSQLNVKEEKCNQTEVTGYISYSLLYVICTSTVTVADSSKRLWWFVRATSDPERSSCRLTEQVAAKEQGTEY